MGALPYRGKNYSTMKTPVNRTIKATAAREAVKPFSLLSKSMMGHLIIVSSPLSVRGVPKI
jgi:hypothetical protein